MDTSKQKYLQSLVQWGEETKNKLMNSQLSERNLHQWVGELEDWQSSIEDCLNLEGELEDDQLSSLENDGQRILNKIKNDLEGKHQNKSVAYGKHKLPPLPYDYDALEPYISKEIMQLHHKIHHQSYVDGLNRAEEELYKAKNKMDDKLIKHWMREQAFNGSGHNLHTIFWYNMTPNSSKRPTGELAKQIDNDFGSWKAFKELFTNAAASVEGVGWAVLAWNPRSGRLVVQTFEKHQQFQYADTIPLLVLDVWEHAYYLQYKTDKKEYIKNWWNVVNWQNVNKRFEEAKKVLWPLY